MTSQKLILVHWACRNRAGVFRNLLDYCELSWKNKFIDKKDPEAGMICPQIPYLLDGDKKITETLNLLNYIPRAGNKKELTGETKKKHKEVEAVIKEAMILRDELERLIETKGDFSAVKDDFFKGDGSQGREILHKFDRSLKDKEWLVEDISTADFYFFELVDLIHDVEGKRLENLPHLLCFRNRFVELPHVKAHRSSKHFLQQWFVPGTTCWNNKEKLW